MPVRSARANGPRSLVGEGITDGANGPYEVAAADAPEGMAKTADVDIDRPRTDMDDTWPGGDLKLIAGVDTMRVLHEVQEQAKLRGRKMNDTAVPPHEVRRQVDFKIAKGELLRAAGIRKRVAFLQSRPNGGDKFFRHQRPCEALIGTGREDLILVSLIARREQHQNDGGPGTLFKADTRAERPHVDTRSTGFQKQYGRGELAQAVGQAPAIGLPQDLQAHLAQDISEEGGNIVVLVGQENQWRRVQRSG